MSKKTDNDKIRELAGLLDETNLTEIEIESSGTRIRVARGGVTQAMAPVAAAATQPPATAPSASSAGTAGADDNIANHPGAVKSPMVGTVYLASEPGVPPFCKVGDQVSEGQTLFIVEAMKTMNPIAAPKGGTVKQICVANAQPVEFGEALAIIE